MTYYVRIRVPKITPVPTQEALSKLVLALANRQGFQGLQDWSVHLPGKVKVLGTESEFYDLRLSGRFDPEIKAFFSSAAVANAFRLDLKSIVEDLSVDAAKKLKRIDWMLEWRRHYRTQVVGSGVCKIKIVPAWKKRPKVGRSLRIYPGQAFGTGTHPTTRLCLELLFEQKFHSVLDFGAGTGILALAALEVSENRVSKVAVVESDSVALDQCKKNFRLNKRKANFLKKLPKGAFDLVFANVLAPVLLGERKRLAACLERPGVIIVSGILSKEGKDFANEFVKGTKLKVLKEKRQGDWSAFVFAKV